MKSTRASGHRKHFSSGLVYGINPCLEVLRAGRRRVHKAWYDERFQKKIPTHLEDFFERLKKLHVPISFASAHYLDKMCDLGVHQGILFETDSYPYFSLQNLIKDTQEKEIVLALDQITDPQNLGALARAAWAFGVRYVMVPQDRTAKVTGVALKASSGALEHLKIISVVNLARALAELKEHEFWIYGAAMADQATPLAKHAPANKHVWVLGSEGEGIRSLIEKTCDELVKIPMAHGFDSINVSQAGAIVLQKSFEALSLSSGAEYV